MDTDWEVEIGGGAPVIEADWSGFVDLRTYPERIGEIAEAAAFSPLATLLLALNGATSPLWTSKCDVWEPEPTALACYVDMLPIEGRVFAERKQAEAFCREYLARITPLSLAQLELEGGRSLDVEPVPDAGSYSDEVSEDIITLVVRQAVAGSVEGFGITAYLSAKSACTVDTSVAIGSAMAAFADALPAITSPAMRGSTLK